MSKSAIVIGAGISGLSSALYLAKNGYEVQVMEKNLLPGGRARKMHVNGFTYDMGPSWYWMPDVMENFFADFGYKSSDFYELERLDPAYRVYFSPTDYVDVPAGTEAIVDLFESIEKGSGDKLIKFLKEAELKYKLGMGKMVHKPGKSPLEFIDFSVLFALLRTNAFKPLSSHVRKLFKNPRLVQILEFPVLFLGASPDRTPALFSLMNYADFGLGTWYPKGGMFKLIEAMVTLAKEYNVNITYGSSVEHLDVIKKKVSCALSNKKAFFADNYVVSADYHFADTQLLAAQHRSYSKKYWDSQTLAPSSLLIYLGVNRKIPGLLHHTLLFDTDYYKHARQIYDTPQWPSEPSMYISCTSKSDDSVAPEGHENVMILIPVAPGLDDNGKVREHYYNLVLERIEKITGVDIKDNVVYKRIYAHSDFINDYNAFKGNAYGLANTLRQTAFFRPKIKHKFIKNLFFAGQLTVPGPGVPPSLISGKLAANELIKSYS